MVPILHCLQPEHILGTLTKLVLSNYSILGGVIFPLSRGCISEAFFYYFFYLVWVLMTKRFTIFKIYKPVLIRRSNGKYNILIWSALCVQQNQHQTQHIQPMCTCLTRPTWTDPGKWITHTRANGGRSPSRHYRSWNSSWWADENNWVGFLISAHMATNGFLMHFWSNPVQVCASYSP